MSITEFFSVLIAGDFDHFVTTVTLATVMIVMLLLGFPMLMPLSVAALIGMLYFSAVEPVTFIQQTLTSITPTALIAVPMFILAADIMVRGKIATNLLNLVQVFVGHWRGGLPITTAFSCTLFGSISGSTQATVVSVGRIMRPRMLKAGYKDSFIIALIINASDIAYMIPPSIAFILYGILGNTSVAELFIAGIGPGLFIAILFSLYSYVYSTYHKDTLEDNQRASWGERFNALRKGILSLGFPFMIIGGIYSGAFTPTEAASFSVLYAIILEYFIYREITLRDIFDAAVDTGMITAVVFILVGVGQAFSWYISFEMIPQTILEGFDLQNASKEKLLMIISLSFFIGCMFVDSVVVLLILTPIFASAVTASGLDPVLVGVIVSLQMAIGSATPPFGCDIFTAVAVFKKPYLEVIRGIFPFIAILIFTTFVLIYFPQLALGLRDLAFR